MSTDNTLPPQHQNQQPGQEIQMHPAPESFARDYKAAGKLTGQVALITGGDSGIGRAAAVAYAKEGAHVAIVYLNETTDAEQTAEAIHAAGRETLLIQTDISQESHCQTAVARVIEKFGRLDILVNNAAEQHPQASISDIDSDQLERTFRTNVFAQFYLVKAALPHLKLHRGRIINTTSVTAYRGSGRLLDYAATKGAIVAFTRSLAQSLVEEGIRVNAVAPGPIWTPLIPSTFDEESVATFGKDVPMKRPGQPDEVAPAYVFLASDDSSYITGQVIHPNGGVPVNG
ncbi:General stress protein 39 [Andreprevotia sp. IGB-42]|uniref:SDR family oxidoreductase n=1 Tax=Andreprevotia sp. IGB-42 TaxID=2497473 RepID=UPI00135ADD13|nr:SDR family oxidoreductase [Andreprevotia sp. IGB-42]KAF0811471.1 General stress protein 39 [Andreprevotia sp. IGB-42]